MRLLTVQGDGTLSLESFDSDDVPAYAILSHTWGPVSQEVTFDDISHGSGQRKDGFRKLDFCREQAAKDDIKYFWVDTCCIDKTSSSELQEAITSMFSWYKRSARCYVYLSDLHVDDSEPASSIAALRRSRWFTRGWTLQELLAPASVDFFDRVGKRIGDKTSLVNTLHEITCISIDALHGRPLATFSIDERMSWARGRDTKRKEDKVYSLIGIFGVSMLMNYGEGEEHAMNRFRTILQQVGPERRFILPLGRNRAFVGRDRVLDKLMETIPPTADPQDCQRIAVEGLGGVGKTQIALEAAYRVREKYPNCSIFWVSAVSRTSFENSYREVAQALKISGSGGDEADIKALVKAALTKSQSRWLLIIDNIDDPELLLGGADEYDMREYLPSGPNGSILFTTRNHEAVVRLDILLEQTLELKEMSEAEALKMLSRAIKPKQMQDVHSNMRLLELLAYLPLAIKQASAYMARTGLSTSKYLKYYRESDESQIKFLSEDFEDRHRYGEIANPIATTWLISFGRIERNHPVAARCLKRICFLAEKDIPRSLFSYNGLEMEVDKAIGVLTSYAFIVERDDFEAYDIHRLVRLATLKWIGNERAPFVQSAIGQLAQEYPSPEHKNRDQWIRLVPHAEAALSASLQWSDRRTTAVVFSKVGKSYRLLGNFAAAVQMHRQALQLRTEELGPTHPDTMSSMNDLASVLVNSGEYDEAGEMHQKVLELRTQELGLGHPDTLASMNNYGNMLKEVGKPQEAGRIYQKALRHYINVSGLKDPNTLRTMNNFASALGDLGEHQESERIHREAKLLHEEVLGPKHPDTLSNLSNLGWTLSQLGRGREAEQIHRQVLQVRIEVHGVKHPETLSSMNNLADALDGMGQYAEAEKILRQTLQVQIEVQGPNHPDTLRIMKGLAGVLAKLGRPQEGESILQQIQRLKKERLEQ